ncbi:MAG TPA: MFS transporter [Candidatus Aminicenantes bacterium]|nr:MFS transporter [Candidatus Aminicenantes bacterium]
MSIHTRNPLNHSAEYRYRRFLNWFPLGLTYATFYMGRYNLNVASTEIMKTFSLSKGEFGIIASAGFWTYALSVLINGPLTDRIGGKKSILIGAAGASVLNLVIGLLFLAGWQTKIIVGMSLLYSVNQYFQSFGALSVVKVNAPWFHVKERGVFGGIFGIMISSGYWLAMGFGGWILAHFGWKWVFIVPSALIALMAVVDHFLVRNKPEDAGFAKIQTDDATADMGAEVTVPYGYVIRRAFANPVVLTLMVAEFCTGFVRQGLMLWFTPFLKEVHGIAPGSGLHEIASLGITVGGIVGGLICGFLSDRFFQSRRPPVAFLFYLGQIASLLMLGFTTSPLLAALLIGFSCMWIFGVHGMLSGTASMDFGGTRGAATVAGLLDGVQYLASGITGFGLGSLIDKFGWDAWTLMIVPFSLVGSMLMLKLWNATPQKNRELMNRKGF